MTFIQVSFGNCLLLSCVRFSASLRLYCGPVVIVELAVYTGGILFHRRCVRVSAWEIGRPELYFGICSRISNIRLLTDILHGRCFWLIQDIYTTTQRNAVAYRVFALHCTTRAFYVYVYSGPYFFVQAIEAVTLRPILHERKLKKLDRKRLRAVNFEGETPRTLYPRS